MRRALKRGAAILLVLLVLGAGAAYAWVRTEDTRTRTWLEAGFKNSTFGIHLTTLDARCTHSSGYLWYCDVDVDQGGADGIATTNWLVRKHSHCWTAERTPDYSFNRPTKRTLNVLYASRDTC